MNYFEKMSPELTQYLSYFDGTFGEGEDKILIDTSECIVQTMDHYFKLEGYEAAQAIEEMIYDWSLRIFSVEDAVMDWASTNIYHNY